MMPYNRIGCENNLYRQKTHEIKERKYMDYLKLLIIVILFIVIVLYVSHMKV